MRYVILEKYLYLCQPCRTDTSYSHFECQISMKILAGTNHHNITPPRTLCKPVRDSFYPRRGHTPGDTSPGFTSFYKKALFFKQEREGFARKQYHMVRNSGSPFPPHQLCLKAAAVGSDEK